MFFQGNLLFIRQVLQDRYGRKVVTKDGINISEFRDTDVHENDKNVKKILSFVVPLVELNSESKLQETFDKLFSLGNQR